MFLVAYLHMNFISCLDPRPAISNKLTVQQEIFVHKKNGVF